MRRGLTAAAAAAIMLLVATPALAEPGVDCRQTNRFTSDCDVRAVAPPTAPSTQPVGTAPGGDTDDGDACFIRRPNWIPLHGEVGDPVPCESGGGVFSNDLGCYLHLADPQPPAGDPAWEGHDPATGAVYDCISPLTTALNRRLRLATPPEPPIAPGELARRAVAQMGLRAIQIGLAPEPGGVGLVGMPVWLWAAAPDGTTFGPTSATATAGSVTVTATARVDRIVWDLGDSSTVTCTTAGTPYEPRFGRAPSPDCGHTYVRESVGRPGDAYTVTATSYWVVTWQGAGQTGSFSLDGLNSEADIQIAEAQVLTN